MEEMQYVKNRIINIICEFGDGKTEFNTRDVNRILDQLGIEEQQNEMLVKELIDCNTAIEQRDNFAIGFARFIASLDRHTEAEGSLKVTLVDNNWFWQSDTDGDYPLSEEELFEIYVQHLKNKNNGVESIQKA